MEAERGPRRDAYVNHPEGQGASRIARAIDHERVASRGHDPVLFDILTEKTALVITGRHPRR